jgi:hypothetical protein
MKIVLIIPNTIENAPYIEYYTDIFKKYGKIEYSFITWNRELKPEKKTLPDYIYEFNLVSPVNISKVKKTYHFWLFKNYAIKILNTLEIDLIIVFTLQNAFFLSNYLKKYSNKYIFDIRDYTPFYPLMKRLVSNLIKQSAITVISSLGYKNWLPRGHEYLLSHNVKKELIINAINRKIKTTTFKKSKPIKILTIGQIRDYSSNSKLIISLQNKSNVELSFVGDGSEVESLKRISAKSNNVTFSGRYLKSEEPFIVENHDLLNILLPDSIAHNTPMSNRFYLSLMFRKPMIVNIESFQTHYVSKYNIGIIVRNEDDLFLKINEFQKSFSEVDYLNNCRRLLVILKKDIDKFEEEIQNILFRYFQ